MTDLTFIGSVLVWFILRKNAKSGSTEKASCTVSIATTVINKGEGRLNDRRDDIIIVGVGVSGAALAHTLGKKKSEECKEWVDGEGELRRLHCHHRH
ncbi:hypothetical protein ACS0TY_024118 [Phlomoides rotata]